jgi:ATP-dependent protease Clp ATPase subunit
MLEIMYDLPTRSSELAEVRIDTDVIEKRCEPVYIAREKKESA